MREQTSGHRQTNENHKHFSSLLGSVEKMNRYKLMNGMPKFIYVMHKFVKYFKDLQKQMFLQHFTHNVEHAKKKFFVIFKLL